jgi:hypothetical protein
MIQFNISQMSALVLQDNVILSNLLKSQITNAPSKADIWSLRCERDELVTLEVKLKEALEISESLQSSVVSIVVKELTEILIKHT